MHDRPDAFALALREPVGAPVRILEVSRATCLGTTARAPSPAVALSKEASAVCSQARAHEDGAAPRRCSRSRRPRRRCGRPRPPATRPPCSRGRRTRRRCCRRRSPGPSRRSSPRRGALREGSACASPPPWRGRGPRSGVPRDRAQPMPRPRRPSPTGCGSATTRARGRCCSSRASTRSPSGRTPGRMDWAPIGVSRSDASFASPSSRARREPRVAEVAALRAGRRVASGEPGRSSARERCLLRVARCSWRRPVVGHGVRARLAGGGTASCYPAKSTAGCEAEAEMTDPDGESALRERRGRRAGRACAWRSVR